MRKGIIGLCAVLILGCAGIQEMIEQATNVQMEVKQGEDAVHPADFPLSPPEGGTLMNSTNMSMTGLSTRIVVYELPADTDATPLLDKYEAEIKQHGTDVQRTATRVAFEGSDGRVMAVELTSAGDKTVVTLTEASINRDAAE
ncbi:MAG: hypothetical protein AAGA48_32775 [Myxococcota bacterium]